MSRPEPERDDRCLKYHSRLWRSHSDHRRCCVAMSNDSEKVEKGHCILRIDDSNHSRLTMSRQSAVEIDCVGILDGNGPNLSLYNSTISLIPSLLGRVKGSVEYSQRCSQCQSKTNPHSAAGMACLHLPA